MGFAAQVRKFWTNPPDLGKQDVSKTTEAAFGYFEGDGKERKYKVERKSGTDEARNSFAAFVSGLLRAQKRSVNPWIAIGPYLKNRVKVTNLLSDAVQEELVFARRVARRFSVQRVD